MNIVDRGLKGLSVGVTTSAALYLLAGDSARANVGGMPLYGAVGVLNGLANVSASFIHDRVLTHIPHNERYASTESFLLNGGIAFGGPAGILYLNGTLTDLSSAGKLGAVSLGSDYLGDTIYERAIRPVIYPRPVGVRQKMIDRKPRVVKKARV